METRAQGALLLAVGTIAVRLGLTGNALTYIKAGYVPLLIASGVVVALLGGLTLWRGLREADPAGAHVHVDGSDDTGHAGHDAGHGHDHATGPRVAWFLAAPLFAILLIAPQPLGAFAASRQSGVVAAPSSAWPELPPAEAGAIPLTLSDYSSRALYDTDRSLVGGTFRLTGFVSEATADGFLLTRFRLSCCAADGTAVTVAVRTDQPAPPVDTWLEVEGTWTNRDDHVIGDLTREPPILEATAVRPTTQPENPYED